MLFTMAGSFRKLKFFSMPIWLLCKEESSSGGGPVACWSKRFGQQDKATGFFPERLHFCGASSTVAVTRYS